MSISTKFWRGKRVLVTGHTGFMGGWLTVTLTELGAKVIGYSLEPPTEPSFFHTLELGRQLAADLRADVRDRSRLSDALRENKPEIVFHLAAQPLVREAFRRPADTFDVNIMGTVNLLEAARGVDGIRSIVVVTSDKVYDNREWEWDYRENDRLGGREPYGVSKACAELVVDAYRMSFLEEAGLGVATVRAGNIIGGGDWAAERLIPDIVRAFSAGATLVIRNPAATRPWQHVLEPVRGCLVLAEHLADEPAQFSGGWNFGPARDSQKPVSWIVQHCAALWGEDAVWKVETGAQPYEAQHLGVTSSKAETRLGWKAIWGIETALAHTVDWYRATLAGRDMLEHTRAQVATAIPAESKELVLGSAG